MRLTPGPAASSRPAASTARAGSSRVSTTCCRCGTRPSSPWRSDACRVETEPPPAVGSMDLAAWLTADRLADHATPCRRHLSRDAVHRPGGHGVWPGFLHDRVHPDGRYPASPDPAADPGCRPPRTARLGRGSCHPRPGYRDLLSRVWRRVGRPPAVAG